MTPEQVMDHYKNQIAVAEAAMCSQPAVAKWLLKGYVPLRSQRVLERHSNGALIADSEQEFAKALIKVKDGVKNESPRAR